MPAGVLQRMETLEWKWDSIAMDFVVGLPRAFDSIWVIIDRLTKSAQFLPINSKFSTE